MVGVESLMRLGVRNDLEAAIFDMDGTLVDSAPGIGSSLAAAFRAIGREMPATDVRSAIGPPIRVIAKRLEPTLTDVETLAIERAYRPLYDNDGWRATAAFDGVAQTLPGLRDAGLRLFLATNKPRIPALKILELLGIANLFEAVITRDSRTPHFTSKAEMLGGLLATHGLRGETAVMVGDTLEDRLAAEENGVRFIFASYGYGDDPGAETAIARFSELSPWMGLKV